MDYTVNLCTVFYIVFVLQEVDQVLTLRMYSSSKLYKLLKVILLALPIDFFGVIRHPRSLVTNLPWCNSSTGRLSSFSRNFPRRFSRLLFPILLLGFLIILIFVSIGFRIAKYVDARLLVLRGVSRVP